MISHFRRPLILLCTATLSIWLWTSSAPALLPPDGSVGLTLTAPSSLAVSALAIAALSLLTAVLGLLTTRFTKSPLLALFAVLGGPAALSYRTGSLRERMLAFQDSIPHHYPALALEAAFLQSLFIIIALVTCLPASKSPRHPNPILNPPNASSFVTALLTCLLAFIFNCFFLRNDQPPQICWGLFAAFTLASLVAHQTVPSTDRLLPLLLSPAVVAIIAYMQTRFAYPDSLAWLRHLFSGRLLGTALPLPLQYISFGTLGVLLGTSIAQSLSPPPDEHP